MWVQNDGTKTNMNAQYTDGCYVFTTNHLSVYQIVKSTDTSGENPDVSKEPSNNNGQSTPSSVPVNSSDNSTPSTSSPDSELPVTGDSMPTVTLFVLVAVSCSAVFVISKKKKHD